MANTYDLANTMRREGMTYREIGEKLGVSRQRAYQIVTGGRTYIVKNCAYPRVAERMYELGMTQRMLAEKTGICYQNVTRLLHMKQDMRISTAIKIADALGLTLEEAFIERQMAANE